MLLSALLLLLFSSDTRLLCYSSCSSVQPQTSERFVRVCQPTNLATSRPSRRCGAGEAEKTRWCWRVSLPRRRFWFCRRASTLFHPFPCCSTPLLHSTLPRLLLLALSQLTPTNNNCPRSLSKDGTLLARRGSASSYYCCSSEGKHFRDCWRDWVSSAAAAGWVEREGRREGSVLDGRVGDGQGAVADYSYLCWTTVHPPNSCSWV